MPPRKSARTSANQSTADSAPTPPASTSTRRRSAKVKEEPDEGSGAQVDGDDVLPSKSKGRGSVNESSSTRPRRSKAPVAQDDGDNDDAAHEAVKEDDEDDDVPKKPSKPKSRSGATSGGKSRATNRSKRIVESDPEESDDTVQPPRRSEEEANSDDDDFESAPRRKPSSSKRGAATSRSSTSRGGPAPRSSKGVTASRKSVKSEPAENVIAEDDEDDLPAFTPSRSVSKAPPTPKPAPRVNEEEEEEEDLLEAIKSVPPTPNAKRPGLSVPPSVRKSGGTSQAPGISMQPVIPEKIEEDVPEGPRSRLVIHKLVLFNFKSYAGKQEIGPFHKSFSAIVGPNGSGKSNTIDALLFVFGYRASKMRQGKLSELIHNSAEHPDLDECRVEVWFREIEDLPGPDAFSVIPNSRLVVARSAYRNNSSIYTINGEKSSFTEVTTLLKDRGIDLDHKRFLILQGEVESIALMKPKATTPHEEGLLEYLEDIIGTSKYKEPIEETLIEVDHLNEERSEKLNRLRLIEKDKAGLEEKKKEAEAWLRNKNELVRAQNKLYQYYMYGHTTAEHDLTLANETLTTQLQQEKDKNADNIAEIDALQKAYDERVKAFEVVKKETAPLVKQLQALEKQEVQLEEKRKHIMTKGKKLTKSLKEDVHAKGEAEEWVRNHTEAMDKHRREIDGLEASLEKEEAELEKITDGLKDKTQVFHAQIEAKQKDLEPWHAKINKKQAELDLAVDERKMLSEKAGAMKSSVSEAAKVLEGLINDKTGKESAFEALTSELARLKKEAISGEKKLHSLEEQEQKLRSKLSSSRNKSEEAKASQAANKSQNAVLESLNRLKASGRITGFHGRLGDLGTIPDKYDVAMSTACPALNHLVVDEVKQGEACLAYLKQQNVGRASIYVLEKLGKSIPAVNTPENAPRLFDLVTPKDSRFAPAFYKAVRDTLVAENLEQANRLAFGGQRRWRVVTLAGQLIDTSGTMSGGGTRVAKGLMSSKFAADVVRPEVIRQYEQEAEEAGRALEVFLQEKRDFANELDELTRRIPKVEVAISKAELDIQTGDKRIKEAKARLKELESQNKPDAGDVKRISSLESEIASVTKEVDKLRAQAATIQAEIQSLQNKILEIGGTKLRSQKAKVEGIKEMIDLANEQITKAEVGKAKCEKDAEKLAHAIEAAEAQLEQLQAEVEEIDGVLGGCREDMAGVREKVELAQDIAEKHTHQLEEMKAELDEKSILINKFRTKEMAIKQKLDDNSRAIAEERRQMKALQERLEKLALDDVDEEDEDEDGEGAEKPKTEEAETPAEREAPVATSAKGNPYELPVFAEEELEGMDPSRLKGEVAKLEGLLGEGQPNMKALEEYRRREADFLKRVKDVDEITLQRDNTKKRHDDLRKARLEEFMSGFNTISSKLKEMYQMITLGGNAELELVDSMDPFSEGIIFSVMPPKKSWKNISNLSGGEKTLSSLALVFALHVFKPTPLYFMDEIDAALDFRNVSIVANYIKDRTKNAQFIIISLRNDMFELSHRLIGIYKTSNATRSIAIDNKPLSSVRK